MAQNFDGGNTTNFPPVLEIAVGHRPFSYQFHDWTDQNRYARTHLLNISNGESNDMFLLSINGLIHISSTVHHQNLHYMAATRA